MDVKMTFDEWVKKYKPIKNENGSVTRFEISSGDASKNTINAIVYNVWTHKEEDEGEYILNGCHWVNRVTYYITEIPYDENDYIVVDVE